VSVKRCDNSQVKSNKMALFASPPALHRINETGAVNELALAGRNRFPELRQLLGRHGEIGIEDYQDVAARGLKAGEHGITLARGGCGRSRDERRRRARSPRRPRPGTSLDEDDLAPLPVSGTQASNSSGSVSNTELASGHW
jgi:hypothetical protein